MEPTGKGYLLGKLNALDQSRCCPRVKNQQGSPQPPPTAYAGTHLLTAGLGWAGCGGGHSPLSGNLNRKGKL